MLLLSSITSFPRWVVHTVASTLSFGCQCLLFFSFFLSIAYSMGWIHRWLWHIAESEASKILNDTPVTIGCLRCDLLRGKVWASNIILHAPRRAQWKWQSPVLARIGKVYVECNVVAIAFFFWCCAGEEIPLELVTVEISDVQCFVERKQQVFNFYLMDPHVDVPDPVEDDDDEDDYDAEHDQNSEHQPAQQHHRHPRRHDPHPVDTTLEWDATTAAAASAAVSSGTPGRLASTEAVDSVEQASQRLVDDMVRALGRVAQQGSLSDALVESRKTLTSKLRALQQKNHATALSEGGGEGGFEGGSNNKAIVMQEGVKIVQQVSKSLVTKTQALPQVVVPARRSLGKKEKIVYGRVGRIVVQDARVFTRDHQWNHGSLATTSSTATSNNEHDGDGPEAGTAYEDDHDRTTSRLGHRSKSSTRPRSSSSSSYWNKPIYMERVVLRAAELCPPLSARDENNLPLVYQDMGKILDVVIKRVLTEMAKSNTGQFFQTAMEEVLDYWMDKDTTTTTATSTAGSGSAGVMATSESN